MHIKNMHKHMLNIIKRYIYIQSIHKTKKISENSYYLFIVIYYFFTKGLGIEFFYYKIKL